MACLGRHLLLESDEITLQAQRASLPSLSNPALAKTNSSTSLAQHTSVAELAQQLPNSHSHTPTSLSEV